MKRKTMLILVATAAVVCGVAFEASANAIAGAGGGSCVVPKVGGGATTIRAIAAVVIPNAYLDPNLTINSSATVDMTLRVQKGSVFQAFRLQLGAINLFASLDNTVIACYFLDPFARGAFNQSVADFVQSIADFLGLGPVTRFVITDKSITNTEVHPSHNQQICADVMLDAVTGLPRCTVGTFGASSVADIVFYNE